ncbi:MAG: aryl-sulfate sulfotransferase [Planctomycetes bacterium]|nr:aryl-sulfate sulfotransferase [Planctomycetota bacterium]
MLLLTLLSLANLPQEPAAPPPARATPAAEKRGLLKKAESASAGFTLLAPLRSTSTYLLDVDGKTVHEWKSDAPPGQSVYLLPNGNLLRCERVASDVFEGGGQGGRVRELDWDGKLVWEYVCADGTRLQHHDIEPLPNGNVLLIAWELKSEAEALAAGRDPRLLPAKQLWPDMVLEIEPVRPSGGKLVWEWHAWDHLVQQRDPQLPNFGEVAKQPQRIDVNISSITPEPTAAEREELEKLRKLGYVGDDKPAAGGGDRGGGPGRGADWFHCNSIDYSPELDMIVLSSRELSELWFIDHSTTTAEAKGSSGGRWGHGGDLLFRWGNPRWHKGTGERTLFGQHDAQWIPAGLPGAGNVLVFNNGEQGLREFSSADELRMPFTSDTLKDAFTAAGGVRVELVASSRSPDFSSHISGAQRLANGNTLVCAGETGRVVELTPAGEVVWEFLNPLGGDAPLGGPPGGRGERGERGGPPGGAPPGGGPPRARGPGGPGGPGDARALFRATHIAPDHPALARLKP